MRLVVVVDCVVMMVVEAGGSRLGRMMIDSISVSAGGGCGGSGGDIE